MTCSVVVMIRDPPGLPVIRKFSPSFLTMVGVIDDSMRFSGSILFASPPINPLPRRRFLHCRAGLPCVPLRGQAAAQNVQRAVNVIDRIHIAKQAFFGKAARDDMIQKRG